MSNCDGCSYPALDCPCCCKQKAILQGLINRVGGYECYLKSLVVPASCQGLSNATIFPNVVGGRNSNYKLDFVHSGVSCVKLWPAIGCQCSFVPYCQPLYKSQGDCWGPIPIPGANALLGFGSYLNVTYGPNTLSKVSDLVTELALAPAELGTIKATIDWTREIRKVYGSILSSLPC